MSGFKPYRRLTRSRQGFHTSKVADEKASIFPKIEAFSSALSAIYQRG